MAKNKTIFITATDTGVGKTVTTFVLGVLLNGQGFNVGVMKPAQCGGGDAQFLRKSLNIKDDPRLINPFYAPEPISPHLAFHRAGLKFDPLKVRSCLKELQERHDIVLIEGAGGLMVPLTNRYFNADLMADVRAPIIIVARLGLGTLNHTLLTINQAKARGLMIKGIIFCQTKPSSQGLPESTNPQEIEKLSGVKVLGTIPFLKPLNQKNILRRCKDLKVNV